MAATPRAALAFALVLAPALVEALEPPGVGVALVLAPEAAPGPGEALAARAAVEGPPGLEVELRAWLEGPGLKGAQAWDGAAWQRADRYQLRWALDAQGLAEGWLAVRAAEPGQGPWQLRVRVREPEGRVLAEAAGPLGALQGELRAGLAPGAAAVAAWDGPRLLALAPAHPFVAAAPGWGIGGHFALRAPAHAALRALDARGGDLGRVTEPSPGPLRVAALLVDPQGGEDGEFLRIAHAGLSPEPLAGWWLAGPGWRAVLRSGELAPGQGLALARNATAYAQLTGRADVARDVAWEGTLQLPNPGGRVELGHLLRGLDAVAWGRAPAGPGWEGPPLPVLPPGRVHRRAAGLPDTNTSADFGQEPWMAGWEPRAPLRVEGDAVVFGRDGAYEVALAALARARAEVLVEVYALTHPGLAGALHGALTRGARVHILVEGAPVGGEPEAQRRLLDGLAREGAQVLRIGGTGRDRYATMHAKFAVLDREAVLLGSENWGPAGFPEGPGGNLGWGVWFRSPALAGALVEVWRGDADVARGDVRPWEARGGEAPVAPSAPAMPVGEPATATLLLAPEHARGEVLAVLARAERALDVEALQMPLAWSEGPNPVVEALKAAAGRGVRVRALLDGTPGGENEATAAALGAWAAGAWPLEARLAREARVHNKGVVVDGALVLVGSLNFGEAAMTRNREAALLLEGAPAASLAAMFEEDWQRAGPEPEPVRAEPLALVAPLAVLAALAAWRGRRRG